MDEVLPDLQGVVAAQGSRGGLDRVGGADQATRRLDRPWALGHQRDQRAGDDEVDQLAEERLGGMLAVVGLGDRALKSAQFEGDQGQPLAFQPADDLADEATADAIGLDQNEGAFDGHGTPSPSCSRGQPRSSDGCCGPYPPPRHVIHRHATFGSLATSTS